MYIASIKCILQDLVESGGRGSFFLQVFVISISKFVLCLRAEASLCIHCQGLRRLSGLRGSHCMVPLYLKNQRKQLHRCYLERKNQIIVEGL